MMWFVKQSFLLIWFISIYLLENSTKTKNRLKGVYVDSVRTLDTQNCNLKENLIESWTLEYDRPGNRDWQYCQPWHWRTHPCPRHISKMEHFGASIHLDLAVMKPYPDFTGWRILFFVCLLSSAHVISLSYHLFTRLFPGFSLISDRNIDTGWFLIRSKPISHTPCLVSLLQASNFALMMLILGPEWSLSPTLRSVGPWGYIIVRCARVELD